MIAPRTELLAIQKRLYRQNQEIIESSILVNEPDFDRYERAYRRRVAKYDHITTHGVMVEAILHSDIIYVGDYHTLNQSQRSFLRILRAVVERDPRFVVGMELLHKRYQKVLDRFLAGTISEKTFLKRCRIKEHWVFDLWENFKPLFDFCRYHDIPMVAIDAAPVGSTLSVRDKASAEVIVEARSRHPNRRMFVLIGDLHIAPEHLPREVEKLSGDNHPPPQDVILYQNSVSIYWKLAEQKLEDRVEVVRLDDRSYCRMHTPPVIAQHSYLNWLEHEEGEIDYHDAKHQFLEIAQQISTFLKMRISRSDLDSVDVFTAGDLSFLRRLRETKVFSKEELEIIKRQILSSESYYIAKARFVYLATLSLNHAAEEAAHFLKHVKSGAEKPRELIDAFYANILHEALGFWGSKIINHRRKCHHEGDFRKLRLYFESIKVPLDRRLEHEATNLILEYLRYERRGKPLHHADIFQSRMDLFLAVTHAIGYMLGDRLYYGLVDGHFKKSDVRNLFSDPWSRRGEPFAVYWELRQKLRGVTIPKRV